MSKFLAIWSVAALFTCCACYIAAKQPAQSEEAPAVAEEESPSIPEDGTMSEGGAVYGLRKECRPPIGPEHNGKEICMYYPKDHPDPDKQGMGCCAYTDIRRDENETWFCVSVWCQSSCRLPYAMRHFECDRHAEDEEPAQEL
jgi:hypothetical protein